MYVFILLIKENDRSASTMVIGSMQAMTSKQWMFVNESKSQELEDC